MDDDKKYVLNHATSFMDNIPILDINRDFLRQCTYVLSSHEEDAYTGRGIHLYQDALKPSIAYRLHRDYDWNDFFPKKDLELQKILETKSGIKLTKFPYGLVRYNEKIAGQIIPYYNKRSQTLGSYLYTNKDEVNTFEVFLKIYDILKELYDNGLIYVDVKSDNFMVQNHQINLIDFDYYYIKEVDNNKYIHMKHLVENFCFMIEWLLQDKKSLYFKDLNHVRTLEELEEILHEALEKSKSLVK